jgi:cysteine-S-conjugate beta-lyase
MKDSTLVTVLGRDPHGHHGIVNPPTYRASTILSPTLETYETRRPGAGSYGRYGTPTTFALQEAVAGLEGGHASIAVGSGKTAITATLLSLLGPGDHLLIADTVYGPTRKFADGLLQRFGVESTYFDPHATEVELRGLCRPTTKLFFLESPGSLTFEVQDVPAIAETAHAVGALVVLDNTWASPLYFKPFAHGVDVSIQAATKYLGGHSDLMMGIVTSTEPLFDRLSRGIFETATAAAPDDCYLALRGLRTLATRLPRHFTNGLVVAEWLAARPEIVEVLHPARPESPDHHLWKRDFLGASGLFGFVLEPCSKVGLAAFLDGLELFGMGASWGGFESLLIPTSPGSLRTAVPWRRRGQAMRIHVGLEDPDDLIADLTAGLDRLRAAS